MRPSPRNGDARVPGPAWPGEPRRERRPECSWSPPCRTRRSSRTTGLKAGRRATGWHPCRCRPGSGPQRGLQRPCAAGESGRPARSGAPCPCRIAAAGNSGSEGVPEFLALQRLAREGGQKADIECADGDENGTESGQQPPPCAQGNAKNDQNHTDDRARPTAGGRREEFNDEHQELPYSALVVANIPFLFRYVLV